MEPGECVEVRRRGGEEAGKLPGWGGALVGRVGPGETALVPLILCPLRKSLLCPYCSVSRVLCPFARWVFCDCHYCIPGLRKNSWKFLWAREQALSWKLSKRGWQKGERKWPWFSHLHKEKSGQASKICWTHRLGLCSRGRTLSQVILPSYRVKGESSLDSEGIGSKSLG